MSLFQIPFSIKRSPLALKHSDSVMLTGSCFTEHIGNRMKEVKMSVLMNPQGILFNPLSLAEGLQACISGKVYAGHDLFYHNETWNSWDFHSRFSHTDKEQALHAMNTYMQEAAAFLRKARWLLVTFGSAYRYYTTQQADGPTDYGVANCHKAPGQWFDKRLLSIEAMEAAWRQTISALQAYNPGLQIVFTVSPVKHLRDGLVENNRSKARLLELAHRLTEHHEQATYFPAYELVTDVLRDYRFFEPDMAHPNGQAAQYVWAQFVEAYMSVPDRELMNRLKEIATAAQHRPRFPETAAAAQFRAAMLQKIAALEQDFPYLDLQSEKRHFES